MNSPVYNGYTTCCLKSTKIYIGKCSSQELFYRNSRQECTACSLKTTAHSMQSQNNSTVLEVNSTARHAFSEK